MVRTRAAISPTGYPHIGTIYQALFDYAFAHRHNGKFVVRIEDTDKERTVADAEEKVFMALDWFGLIEDESVRKEGPYKPYRQSNRLDIYKKYADELINNKKAYHCFCSKERLDKLRQELQKEGKVPMYDKHCLKLNKKEIKQKLAKNESYVIRLNIPPNTQIKIKDELRGEITFESNSVDDQVLMKSDGYPTYFLAVVVDDYLMKITHMVRGEEWLTSSAKIVLLYEYFGWDKPVFVHTPIIRNPDRSKFSKRQGHTNVSWYQEQGFLPEAILNYLSLMGWSHPEGKEIFPLDEFIKLFDFKDIKPIGPVFDLKKLEWMNGMYIRQKSIRQLADQILEFYKNKLPEDVIEKTIPLIQDRIKKLSDYLPLCEFFFKAPATYEVSLDGKKDFFGKVHTELEKVTDWKAGLIGESLVNLAKKLEIKNSQFFMDMRVAMTGKKISPPLNESMEILGQDKCLNRIKKIK
jgi:glutamyl-tRNA synthetase